MRFWMSWVTLPGSLSSAGAGVSGAMRSPTRLSCLVSASALGSPPRSSLVDLLVFDRFLAGFLGELVLGVGLGLEAFLACGSAA